MSLYAQYQEVKEVARTIREEAEGSRGAYYEAFGSAIHPVLSSLADSIESLMETDFRTALNLAKSLDYDRIISNSEMENGLVKSFPKKDAAEMVEAILSRDEVTYTSNSIFATFGLFVTTFTITDTVFGTELTFNMEKNETAKLSAWLGSPVGVLELNSFTLISNDDRKMITVIGEVRINSC